MLHWFNLELWGPMWPNLATSAVIFVPGAFWAHRKLLLKWEQQEKAHLKRHRELKELLYQQAPSGDAGDTPTSEETDDDLRP